MNAKLLWVIDPKDEIELKKAKIVIPADALIIDYEKLKENFEPVFTAFKKGKYDGIVYSRNEQISGVKIGNIHGFLKTGYTSFSAIDPESKLQMPLSAIDFVHKGEVVIKAKEVSSKNSDFTYSLIFDLEQIGGAKFGLPRILKLLGEYNVPATFFTTNIVFDTYSGLKESIEKLGHEVGLHGLYHEDLTLQSAKEQSESIKEMILLNKNNQSIKGANFMGRLNQDTIGAMAENGLDYFAFSLKNNNKKLSVYTEPILFEGNNGLTITGIPVFAETYNRNVESTIRAIENTYSFKQTKHVTVLLHPFRDGSLERIKELEELIKYFQNKNATALTLKHVKKTNTKTNKTKVAHLRFASKGVFNYVIDRLYNNWQIKKAAKNKEKGIETHFKI